MIRYSLVPWGIQTRHCAIHFLSHSSLTGPTFLSVLLICHVFFDDIALNVLSAPDTPT